MHFFSYLIASKRHDASPEPDGPHRLHDPNLDDNVSNIQHVSLESNKLLFQKPSKTELKSSKHQCPHTQKKHFLLTKLIPGFRGHFLLL